MTKPKVAYLIVTWNNRAIIQEVLQSVLDQTYPNKAVYVIDNASADDTAGFIRELFPDINLIAADSNNGFARGNNILIKEALQDQEVKYVALVNSDAVLDKDWTSEIIDYVLDKPFLASAQGATLDYYDHQTIDAEHIYVSDNFQSVQYGYGEAFQPAFAYPRRVFGVNAAAAVYSADFVRSQPGWQLFDEKFYMYLEDVDVAFRAVLTGWENYYIPTAQAFHMGSVSSKKRSSGYNIYMTFRNQTALLVKNMPMNVFFRFLPQALRFEIHFYRHLAHTQGAEVARLAKRGRLLGILRAPIYIPDRIRNFRRRKLSSKQLVRMMQNKGL